MKLTADQREQLIEAMKHDFIDTMTGNVHRDRVATLIESWLEDHGSQVMSDVMDARLRWETIEPGVQRLVGRIDPDEAERLMAERRRATTTAPNTPPKEKP